MTLVGVTRGQGFLRNYVQLILYVVRLSFRGNQKHWRCLPNDAGRLLNQNSWEYWDNCVLHSWRWNVQQPLHCPGASVHSKQWNAVLVIVFFWDSPGIVFAYCFETSETIIESMFHYYLINWGQKLQEMPRWKKKPYILSRLYIMAKISEVQSGFVDHSLD